MTNNEHKDDEEEAEQIRVIFKLDKSVSDRSLEVPLESIAVPANLKRKGLSAVINHLLGRHVQSSNDNEEEEEEDDDEEKLPYISFDFLIKERLLRLALEVAARKQGLSLEDAIPIVYFPAQEKPQGTGEGEPQPDWISCIRHVESNENSNKSSVFAGGYDGSIQVYTPRRPGNDLDTTMTPLETIASVKAHGGPIKCLSTAQEDSSSTVIIASGSLDQTLCSHRFDPISNTLEAHANFVEGHTATISSVDLLLKSENKKLLSGDWDGGLCVWDLDKSDSSMSSPLGLSSDEPPSSKKLKSSETTSRPTRLEIKPSIIISAHGSKISQVAWKESNNNHVVTGSWDHSVKVWDVEKQDCLLTLNGSRVVLCLDVSPHSTQVVATGHPDCSIQLWDVRVDSPDEACIVSDSSLRPSHKSWISAVQWSPNNPYLLSSASYDGTLKVWDIRSSVPLHTVRTKDEKTLCLSYGQNVIYSGGTDCIVKQFSYKGPKN